MKVGDILDGAQLAGLPVGAVVVNDEPGLVFNTLTRTSDGYGWLAGGADGVGRYSEEHGRIYAGGWTLVHLPPVEPLKVGDRIRTTEQAAALPVGAVVVDTKDEAPHRAPAIKVGRDRWLWQSTHAVPYYGSDSDVCASDPDDVDVLVYLPDADSSAGRSAA